MRLRRDGKEEKRGRSPFSPDRERPIGKKNKKRKRATQCAWPFFLLSFKKFALVSLSLIGAYLALHGALLGTKEAITARQQQSIAISKIFSWVCCRSVARAALFPSFFFCGCHHVFWLRASFLY